MANLWTFFVNPLPSLALAFLNLARGVPIVGGTCNPFAGSVNQGKNAWRGSALAPVRGDMLSVGRVNLSQKGGALKCFQPLRASSLAFSSATCFFNFSTWRGNNICAPNSRRETAGRPK